MDTIGDTHPAGAGVVDLSRRGLDAEGLRRIAVSLADQYAVLYDEAPLNPHATLAGEILTLTFEDGLSASDEWLLAAGRDEQLGEFREYFMRVVGDRLGEVIEALSAVEVKHYFTAFEPATRTTSCFFVLREAVRDEGEQRQALLNWSEQVRRKARDLRERHRVVRELHEDLRKRAQAMRLEAREQREEDEG